MLYIEEIKNGKYGLRNTYNDTLYFLSGTELIDWMTHNKIWGACLQNNFLSCQIIKIGRRKRKVDLSVYSGQDLEVNIAEISIGASWSYKGLDLQRLDYDDYKFNGVLYNAEELLSVL